jgi:2-oxo-3-hexenedioate decarboxylase
MRTLSEEMLAAYNDGSVEVLPPTSRDTGFDLDRGYAVEAGFQRLRMEAGRTVAGRKVGFANKAMWRALKLETLVWGHMYDDTVHRDCSELAITGFGSARIEPEIVFKLKQPVTAAPLDAVDALQGVEWLAIGFEIISCPYPGWQFKPADFVAAWGLHRALIIGKPSYVSPAAIPALVEQLAAFQLRLLKNGQVVEEGSGRNSLRSPALCLAELANAILRRTGAAPLAAGELISTGTLTNAPPIAAGEVWSIALEGLPVPSLTLRLA